MLWKVSRLEMIQSRRIRQCFGDLVDRKLFEVGVSGSASEGWLTGSDPKKACQAVLWKVDRQEML